MSFHFCNHLLQCPIQGSLAVNKSEGHMREGTPILPLQLPATSTFNLFSLKLFNIQLGLLTPCSIFGQPYSFVQPINMHRFFCILMRSYDRSKESDYFMGKGPRIYTYICMSSNVGSVPAPIFVLIDMIKHLHPGYYFDADT